jgi:hypothetical protein
MHLASRALACGADFRLIGPEHSFLASARPVISVCAVRTGCGKNSVVRRLAALLRGRGLKPVVVRHPMPYGDLARQLEQRFATIEDCDRQACTVEEREEYEQHIREGNVVYAGVDYERILRSAEQEADLILWDGGNNDWPFFVRISKSCCSIRTVPGTSFSIIPVKRTSGAPMFLSSTSSTRLPLRAFDRSWQISRGSIPPRPSCRRDRRFPPIARI